MKKLYFLIIFSIVANAQTIPFKTVFETSKGTETATYTQTIQYYKNLAKTYPSVSIQEIGMTDAGKPLHIIIYNPNAIFDFPTIRKNKYY